MEHKDIRIQFKIENRRYEAVGFLNEGEGPVSGSEMLKRTAGENGGVIGADDGDFLSWRRDQFPQELQKYILISNWENPGGPRWVSYFDYNIKDGWYYFFGHLDFTPFGNNVLVLRRCA
ncbi:hypothetical protein HY932_00080 [Candidatus Falkowbacteria bacterium]|nr:hypothetical protein [Candidatus Falkowbacteria bacterium]